MATRSTLTIKLPHSTKHYYHHWDGYLEGVGLTLVLLVLRMFRELDEWNDIKIENWFRYNLTHDFEPINELADMGQEYEYKIVADDTGLILSYKHLDDDFMPLEEIHKPLVKISNKKYRKLKYINYRYEN